MTKRYMGYTDRSKTAADLETRFATYNAKVEGLILDSVTDDRAALHQLVNVTMQPNGGVVDVVGVPRVASNVSVPANVRLNFLNGAYLAPDGGVTVTISGPFNREIEKKFGGGGTVTFGAGARTHEAWPQWWGAVADGVTSDSVPVRACHEALYAAGPGRKMRLIKGTHLLTTVDGDGYTMLKSRTGISVIGEGDLSVLKVANATRSVNIGTAVLYNHTEALADMVYRDFSIDYNGQNNLFLGGYSATAGVNRTGGGAGCTNILVDNCLFKNSGGYHFLFFDGIGGYRVVIRNNRFEECGRSIAGSAITDHSSIYCTSNKSKIFGNSFANGNVCEVSTAIETHGTAEHVHDNDIENYSTGYNLCFQVQTNRSIRFHDNTLRNVRSGVVIWGAGNFGLSKVSIHDNEIGLREATGGFPSGFGVACTSTTQASTQNVQHIAIRNNEIFGETNASLALLTTGIQLFRCDNIVIKGNQIHDLVAEAIYLESEVAGRSITGVQIIKNTIKDVGITSTAGNKRAIVFNSFVGAGQKISKINVRANSIDLSASTGTVANFGIQFNAGSFPETRIVANTIIGFATSPITKGAAISADLFYVEGEGPINPFNNIRASLGSKWVDTSSNPRRTFTHIMAASDGNSDGWRSVEYGNAAPATGSHFVGDTCENNAPAVGQPKRWRCTALGTPGTWTSEGNL